MGAINVLELFRIKQAVLKNIDKDIVNHGIETAYIACMLANELNYSKKEIYYLAMAAFMHDIGAYKTEELNNIKQFEVVDTGRHSIYGYAILNKSKIFNNIASSVLYHHHSYKDKDKYIHEIEIPQNAFLIGLADRVSISCNLLEYNEEKITKFIFNMNKDLFNPKHVDILYDLTKNKGLLENIINEKYTDYLLEVIKTVESDIELIKEYLIFLPLSIDFFSFETSLHTVSVSCMTNKICSKMDLNPEYKEKIEVGAYLHDLGKVCTPRYILEKEDKLTTEEFEIMKQHVSYSREILEDACIDKELINLACNHHEKLDGSGYCRGLKSNDLSIGDRIISISDIFCALTEKRHYKKPFPKSRVLEILDSMVSSNYIDKEIVDIVYTNYDEFLEFINVNRNNYENTLKGMLQDYNKMTSKMDKLDFC